MAAILSFLETAFYIFLVVMFFNVMIFVHELGHFWAGRWRGAYIDRFQIWFGKPIWKKEINGVTWGLGWIPAGGFVSLPQLGDMEQVEGEVSELPKDLKPLKPLDKIIIAAAGPLFSLLLAFFFAVIVWIIGKPDTTLDSRVGYVMPNEPAAAAGIIPGDKITAINGTPVYRWAGNMEGVTELIALSEGDEIKFQIERPQADGSHKSLEITSTFKLPESSWYERSGLRRVGIQPSLPTVVGGIVPQSPAAKAGLQVGDRIEAINGTKLYSLDTLLDIGQKGEPMQLEVTREGKSVSLTLKPEIPANWKDKEGARPLIGINQWAPVEGLMTMAHPSPFTQVGQSLKWMGTTFAKLVSPDSDVNAQHLSGPVGIADSLYSMLTSEYGWHLLFWFAVVINVNLAVLNMLPLPIVDGGHVVLGFLEMIFKRPVGGVILEKIQLIFFLFFIGLFIYITMMDVGSIGQDDAPEAPTLPEPVFE